MDSTIILGLLGVILALFVFSFLCYKGVHLYVAVMCAVVVVCITNGVSLNDAFLTNYWPNFTNYLSNYWWIFMSGAMFGSVITVTGAGDVFAHFMLKHTGKFALLGLNLLLTILTYCGFSTYGGGLFAVLPIIFVVFKELDIPRRFVIAIIGFTTCTMAAAAPGAPIAQNIITTTYFGLPLMTGVCVSLVCSVVMFAIGEIMLEKMVAKAKANGEHYVPLEMDFNVDEQSEEKKKPHIIKAVIALISFPIFVNVLPFNMFFSTVIAMFFALIVLWGYWDIKGMLTDWGKVIPGAVTIILGQCAVMGFGGVFTGVPAYSYVTSFLASIPGTPLISCAVATTLMAGISGSGASGINLTLPVMAPIWLETGVAVPAISRTMVVSALAFDSLPHNGALNGWLSGLNVKLRDAYMPYFWLTLIVPVIGTTLMVILFSLFPMLP